jgi:hypothetical protein
MKTVKRCVRFGGAVLFAVLTVSLLLAAVPDDAVAQGKGIARGTKHDWTPPGPPWWKHDGTPPYGPPTCPGGGSPPDCKPGRTLKHDWDPPPGNGVGWGKDEAVSLEFSGVFADLVTAVEEGTLATPRPVPFAAHRALYRVWTQGSPAGETDLALALASRGNATAWTEAVALVEALQWLPYDDAQLPAATEAFNAFLDRSAHGFLLNPAPEFLVVHTFLGTLVEEALKAPAGD